MRRVFANRTTVKLSPKLQGDGVCAVPIAAMVVLSGPPRCDPGIVILSKHILVLGIVILDTCLPNARMHTGSDEHWLHDGGAATITTRPASIDCQVSGKGRCRTHII